MTASTARWGAVRAVLMPMLLLGMASLACVSAPPPTPVPTATPIPGYVAGEEDMAYASFTAYYGEHCARILIFDNGEVFATALYPDEVGRAVYVDDGVWRFHIYTRMSTYDPVEQENHTHEPELETVTARSLPDGTWDDPCPHAGTSYPDAERRDWESEYESRYDHYD